MEGSRGEEAAIAAFNEALAKMPDPPEPILKFFRWDHLPAPLQIVSAPFENLAGHIMTLPRSAERTVALRKLLESKDAAVRAALP